VLWSQIMSKLNSSDPKEREQAVLAIRDSGRPDARDVLVSQLESLYEDVREQARVSIAVVDARLQRQPPRDRNAAVKHSPESRTWWDDTQKRIDDIRLDQIRRECVDDDRRRPPWNEWDRAVVARLSFSLPFDLRVALDGLRGHADLQRDGAWKLHFPYCDFCGKETRALRTRLVVNERLVKTVITPRFGLSPKGAGRFDAKTNQLTWDMCPSCWASVGDVLAQEKGERKRQEKRARQVSQGRKWWQLWRTHEDAASKTTDMVLVDSLVEMMRTWKQWKSKTASGLNPDFIKQKFAKYEPGLLNIALDAAVQRGIITEEEAQELIERR